ncbi:MAG: aconitate hydratase AcnA [Alphaproteobacteria bacterium]|nr:aconitate hydratase AcnA [Alphaproteobacteria bacterium]
MTTQIPLSLNSFNAKKKFTFKNKDYVYYSLPDAEENGLDSISRLPFSLKILLENLLRHEDGHSVKKDDITALARWLDRREKGKEIAFRPARVLMQDFTGVPAVVDLAAMRDAVQTLGGNPEKINPLIPVDLIIDHSIMVDAFGKKDALRQNTEKEYERNRERYTFLKWGQESFANFRVIPPGAGICHQVNLEYLAQTVWIRTISSNGETMEIIYPDTVIGTDSHTTMINGLSVLGWGVGGIEAEAAMLGQPVSMLIPEVIGFKLTGKLQASLTATDLVLTITEKLRKKGVVGKFVEFYGAGIDELSLEDRATISNMAPEYGATCGFFPIDNETLRYLKRTGREIKRIELVEKYAKAQGLFRSQETPDPVFTDLIELDLGSITQSVAGPKRPQDRVDISQLSENFSTLLEKEYRKTEDAQKRYPVPNETHDLGHGDIVIAALTSCTNTSNPDVMIAAGLLARKARAKGLNVKPWVKTSLAPGSQVVTEYLKKAGLQEDLNELGFQLVGYGCTTCIGNSGPLNENISSTIRKHDIVVASVLSGNRNFEGRVHQDVRANYLASPPLVVAYALAGSIGIDLTKTPFGTDKTGAPVYLKDIWPKKEEIIQIRQRIIDPSMFEKCYSHIFKGDEDWQSIKISSERTYQWQPDSTYVKKPPYFHAIKKEPDPITDIINARILALFLDSITTDHISPAGSIAQDSPAGHYLHQYGVLPEDFNSYGSRRGNDRVMLRGTFANIRLKNQMLPGIEGGFTKHFPSGEEMTIYDAAMRYKKDAVPLVIFSGKEYGSGSSRDWAAKGAKLLGLRAVIAESFERIHRSNLIGMGVLPLVFEKNTSWKQLGLKGNEKITLPDLAQKLQPGIQLTASLTFDDGRITQIPLQCRIDTLEEMEYYYNGGILHYMLRQLA